MSIEEERLRLVVTAQESKIRELEEALANCAAIGVKLRKALVYLRDEEPTVEDVTRVSGEALEQDGSP